MACAAVLRDAASRSICRGRSVALMAAAPSGIWQEAGAALATSSNSPVASSTCFSSPGMTTRQRLPLLGQRLPRDAGAESFGAPEGQGGGQVDIGAASPGHAGRFYQRALPFTQVPFASVEGRRLFREALRAGTMENYFFLAEQFRTQDEPTFCGLSTLAMVLNALHIDPMRTWKGSWRWFHEQNLGCCAGQPERVRAAGLTFDMFERLAKCNGANVIGQRAPSPAQLAQRSSVGKTFEEMFRAAVRATSRSEERECIVLCYSREALGQSGAGHFSPIGGYHEATDSVLILDVARFKYPPHWVRIRDIVDAMSHADPATGKPRGWLHFRQQANHRAEGDTRDPLPIRTLYMPRAAGRRLSKALAEALEKDMSASPCSCGETTAVSAMRRWLRVASSAEPQILRQILQVGDTGALREVLARLSMFPAFKELCDAYVTVVDAPSDGIAADFPPLRFVGHSGPAVTGIPPAVLCDGQVADLGLGACGEMWVLLLMMLPDHLRGAVASDLAGPWVARGVAGAVRGPWALPLEANRDALGQLLQAGCSA